MTSLPEIVEKYKNYLLTKYPERHKTFSDLERSKLESARAEAVSFFVLRSQGFDVTIYEDPSTGGPDFSCKAPYDTFIAEVTCLEVDAVTKRSGVEEGASSGWSEPLTDALRTKASTKASQLSGVSMPRLLVLTTEHESGEVLMGINAARSLLTSNPKIQIQPWPSEPNTWSVTELDNSVFFRFSKNGSIEACRQSISAILLIHILPNECRAVGVLHPQPIFNFPRQLLPTVPFVWVRQWPPKEGKIETAWDRVRPPTARFYYQALEPQN